MRLRQLLYSVAACLLVVPAIWGIISCRQSWTAMHRTHVAKVGEFGASPLYDLVAEIDKQRAEIPDLKDEGEQLTQLAKLRGKVTQWMHSAPHRAPSAFPPETYLADIDAASQALLTRQAARELAKRLTDAHAAFIVFAKKRLLVSQPLHPNLAPANDQPLRQVSLVAEQQFASMAELHDSKEIEAAVVALSTQAAQPNPVPQQLRELPDITSIWEASFLGLSHEEYARDSAAFDIAKWALLGWGFVAIFSLFGIVCCFGKATDETAERAREAAQQRTEDKAAPPDGEEPA